MHRPTLKLHGLVWSLLLVVSCAGPAPETVREARILARPGPNGVELHIRGAGALELRLVEVQRGGARQAIEPGRPRPARDRIELARAGSPIVEWYAEDPRGVEHGLDVARAPLPGDAPLRFAFEARGGLEPIVSEDGASVRFQDAHGATRLELAKLVAWDASAKPLPARMRVEAARLVYEVDDRGATYPIVVDPLATAPSFSFVGGASAYQASISTAGDVNGDGYSDLLVGADDGYAYLFLGSATGLSVIPAWRAFVDPDSTQKGVVSAGDVNGDGYDDVLLVTTLGAAQNSGSAYLWLGSATIDVQADGNPLNADWSADSLQVSGGVLTSSAQISASSALDLNGDGFADVAIGWPGLDTSVFGREGSVHVWLGRADFASRPDGRPTNSDWRADGPGSTNTGFGAALAGSGDLNGDGFDDLVVGAPQTGTGNALVWLGGSAFASDPDGTFANADWSYAALPAATGTHGGSEVANAGDVDGDGYADLLLTRISATPIGVLLPGEVVLFRGHPSSVLQAAPLAVYTTSSEYSLMTGATAGDVNGDGLADVVIGRASTGGNGNPGTASVHFGRRGTAPDPVAAATWTGAADLEYFGRAVSTAGDVNGDGFGDVAVMGTVARVFHGGGYGLTATHDLLYGGSGGGSGNTLVAGIGTGMAGDINADGYDDYVVGMPGADEPGLVDAGRFEVDYGGSCGPACGPEYLGGQGFYAGDQAGESLGWSVSGAGDVNGDGYGDVIVGAPDYDATVGTSTVTNAGRARVYYGNPSGLIQSIWTTLDGPQTLGARFGAVVAGAGDVNGDGYADVAVGAPDADSPGRIDNGEAWVYLGSPTGISTSPAWIKEGNYAGAIRLGAALASAGDVNRDGFSDLIVGAPDGPINGDAYVFLGSAAGLSQSHAWMTAGTNIGSKYGTSVASAGDVNGDGYADIVVGQPYDSGYAYVYHGSPSGPSVAPSLVIDGPFGARFGGAVGTAGDVDGDGYSDLLVGAHWFAGPAGSFQGRVSLYFGGPSGLDPARVQHRMDCPTAPCDFGHQVSGAGDLNGDGFSDVLIGAFTATNPSFGDGGVYVHFGNAGTGWNHRLQHWNAFGSPIALLGSVGNFGMVRPARVLRSAAGRARVSLESELELLGTPFDGAGTVLSFAPWDTGTAGLLVSNTHACPLNAVCHWRARVRSRNPYFPSSRWLTLAGNGPEEADVRGPVAPDFDADGVADANDNCPETPNPDQADGDFDAVGNLCDNCTTRANPRLDLESYLRSNPWATVTGAQRDDDHDGFGNRCDAKFPGVAGTIVNSSDLAQFRASNGKNRTGDTCGTLGTRPCAIYDLDEAGLVINSSDLAQFRLLNGKGVGPKCAACPLPCAAGANGGC